MPTVPGMPRDHSLSMAKYREKSGCQLGDIRLNYTPPTMGTATILATMYITLYMLLGIYFNSKVMISRYYIGIFKLSALKGWEQCLVHIYLLSL